MISHQLHLQRKNRLAVCERAANRRQQEKIVAQQRRNLGNSGGALALLGVQNGKLGSVERERARETEGGVEKGKANSDNENPSAAPRRRRPTPR